MNCKYIGCDNEINADISEMFCTKHSQEMDAALAENPKTFMAWSLKHVDMGFNVRPTPVPADLRHAPDGGSIPEKPDNSTNGASR